MITRIWRGITRKELADEYLAYLQETGLRDYSKTRGNRGVMVLRRDGYAAAVKGTSGWVCMVERSWANNTNAPDFWNPKLRAPHCFNAQAARTFAHRQTIQRSDLCRHRTRHNASAP